MNKCLNCGSKRIQKTASPSLGGESWDTGVDAYVCLDCRYVQLEASDKFLELANKRVKEDAISRRKDEYLNKLIALAEEMAASLSENISATKKEMDELQQRTKDDSITMREYQLALKRIEDRETKLDIYSNNVWYLNGFLKEKDKYLQNHIVRDDRVKTVLRILNFPEYEEK